MGKRWFLTGLIAAGWCSVSGQLPSHVRYHTVADGLSSMNVTCIEEDATGYIWVGTTEGLNRFDGTHFTRFYANGEEGLPGEHVSDVIHLGADRLLVALYDGGLAVYHPEKQGFETVTPLESDNKRVFGAAVCLAQESDTTVLVGYASNARSAGGLVRLNLRTHEQHHLHPAILSVASIVPSDRGEWWVLGREVHCLNYNGTTEVKTFESPFKKMRNQRYFLDAAFWGEQVYLGSQGDGIHVYDRTHDQFIENVLYTPTSDRAMTDNLVYRFFEFNQDGALLCTGDRGIGYYDRANNKVAFLVSANQLNEGLQSAAVRSAFRSSNGMVWFATGRGLGVFSLYDVQMEYKPLDAVNSRRPEPKGWFIRAVHFDGGYLLTIAREDHFVVTDSLMEEVRYTLLSRRQEPPFFLDQKDIVTLADGRLIMMGLNALYTLSPGESNVTKLVDLSHYFPEMRNALNAMTHAHTDEAIWLASSDNRVLRLTEQGVVTGSWWLIGDTVFKAQSPRDGLSGQNVILGVVSDGNGGVYVSSYGGLFQVNDAGVTDLSTTCETCVKLTESKGGALCSDGVRIAMATYGQGVFVYDRIKQEVRQYGRDNGVPSRFVHSIAFDRSGAIWGVSSEGLFRVDERADFPVSTFSGGFGMPYEDLTSHFITPLNDGSMVVGFREGLGRFIPDVMHSQPVPTRVVLHEIKVNNRKISEVRNAIVVPFGSTIDIDFAAIGFVDATSYRYGWRFEGETEFKEVRSPKVFLSSVPEGDFTLEIRAGNKFGHWSPETRMLRVHVVTPFVQSKRFKQLLALVFVLTILGLYAVNLRRIRRDEKKERAYVRRIAEAELQALRAQMNPHFLFNTLNSIKFFIIRNEPEVAADYLTRFSRLIRLILANSKSDQIPLSTEMEALGLYVGLEQLRFTREFSFTVEMDPMIEPEFIYVPPLIVQPFVENAIWHGLMHKKNAGAKLVIRMRIEGEYLRIEIEDNGVGRAAAESIRSKTAKKEKSMGVSITYDRLKNLPGNQSGSVEFRDLFDDSGLPSGTLVVLYVPVEL